MINKLSNWEVLPDSEVETAVRTLKMVIESRICGILVEQPRYIETLIKIIDSDNYPLQIQQVSLQAVRAVCRNVSNKSKVISHDIIRGLTKIAASSLDAVQIQKYDYEVRKTAVDCLTTLGGIYDRKMYIPGETRENDRARKVLIENGGLLVLINLASAAIEPDIREMPRQFLNNLELADYEYQSELLAIWRYLHTQHSFSDDSRAVKNTNSSIENKPGEQGQPSD